MGVPGGSLDERSRGSGVSGPLNGLFGGVWCYQFNQTSRSRDSKTLGLYQTTGRSPPDPIDPGVPGSTYGSEQRRIHIPTVWLWWPGWPGRYRGQAYPSYSNIRWSGPRASPFKAAGGATASSPEGFTRDLGIETMRCSIRTQDQSPRVLYTFARARSMEQQ